MTIMIIVYKMVVLHMAYCTCSVVVFCLHLYCMIILFVDNLFIFYLGSQSVSCKASLAALRVYGYFCDYCFMFLSENKYDDDDDNEL